MLTTTLRGKTEKGSTDKVLSTLFHAQSYSYIEVAVTCQGSLCLFLQIQSFDVVVTVAKVSDSTLVVV